MINLFLVFPFLILADQTFSKFGIWSRNGSDYISQETTDNLIKIKHIGEGSYAVTAHPSYQPVEFGDFFQLSVDIKLRSISSTSGVVLSFAFFDENKTVISWTVGQTAFSTVKDSFTTIYSQETCISPGVSYVSCRLTGDKPIEFEMKNMQLQLVKHISINISQTNYSIESNNILFTFDTVRYNFSVFDKRCQREWAFCDTSHHDMILISLNEIEDEVKKQLNLTFLINNYQCNAQYTLYLNEDDSIEFNLNCPQNMPMASIQYPYQLNSVTKDDRFVLPLNEGFSFKADDFSHLVASSHMFGGHGLCMSFFGLFDDSEIDVKKSGLMYIVKSQNDFRLNIRNLSNLQTFCLNWNSVRGVFGSYNRVIQFVFFDKAKHVELCKRYRKYAREDGRLVTFNEKKKLYPKIEFDKLIGSANIWYHTSQNKLLKVYQELQSFGVTNILASNDNSAVNINYMNDEMENVLTSKYDIYQDVLNPEMYKWTKPKQTPSPFDLQAWPNDIAVKIDGDFKYGWSIPNVSNPEQFVPMGVLCDTKHHEYAKKRITEECVTANESLRKNLKCRFIDTTTASEWYECYHKEHSMTRTDSRKYRLKLLSLIHEFNMVCGSETGQDVAVPYCDYFEGMMSIGSFRVPNAGRNTDQIWGCEEENDNSCPDGQERPIPERVIKFQLGQNYRLPLFELVYHDCLVSYWYWGDYNNKMPSLWVKRDMFNALYGVPPMYFFNNTGYDSGNCTADIEATFNQNGVFNQTNNGITTTIFSVKTLHKSDFNQKCFKQRVATSYMIAHPVSKLTGYSEMIDFVILNSERTVQKSVFDNHVTVICNFGDTDYKYEDFVIHPFDVMIQRGEYAGNNDGKNKAGIIAGSVIAVLVVIALVVGGVIFYLKKKNGNQSGSSSSIFKSFF